MSKIRSHFNHQQSKSKTGISISKHQNRSTIQMFEGKKTKIETETEIETDIEVQVELFMSDQLLCTISEAQVSLERKCLFCAHKNRDRIELNVVDEFWFSNSCSTSGTRGS